MANPTILDSARIDKLLVECEKLLRRAVLKIAPEQRPISLPLVFSPPLEIKQTQLDRLHILRAAKLNDAGNPSPSGFNNPNLAISYFTESIFQ